MPRRYEIRCKRAFPLPRCTRTKSSPQDSIAAAVYFALTNALHNLCTPSTPVVRLVVFKERPVSEVSVPGTARMKAEDSVSNASSEDAIRPWYDSKRGS
jgi:hypothetical protein